MKIFIGFGIKILPKIVLVRVTLCNTVFENIVLIHKTFSDVFFFCFFNFKIYQKSRAIRIFFDFIFILDFLCFRFLFCSKEFSLKNKMFNRLRLTIYGIP